jgi:hypothetical protein
MGRGGDPFGEGGGALDVSDNWRAQREDHQ